MREVEARFGEPLEELLPRLYQEGGLDHISKVLGVRKSTIYYWLLRLGFVVERRLGKR